MPKIFEMPPHLADLIAAGEVVERPASVVKELVENSIDAGAKAVTVEIKSGGMAEIRVTDDGSGIAAEDVETAFLRHATSKLRDERGLEAIATLGFRGEALAAIASVSRIELLTRERGAGEGVRLLLEAGVKRDRSPRGLPEGTTIYVRDLFYNTPARQKFMKNDRAEGAAVSAAVVRLALSHPELSLRYIREGREEYHTPGDGRLQSAAYCTLGREFAKGLLEASNTVDGVTVSGLVSTPASCRGNRAWQFFFVNGRAIKSKLLQAAVEQAYRNSLFTGRFPVCLLDIRMGLGSVDVNVHPTKMEVRFSDERRVFDAVYWAVRGALEREEAPKELEISKSTRNAISGDRPVKPSDIPGSRVFAPSERSAPAAPAGSSGGFVPKTGEIKPREDYFKTVSAQDFRSSYAAPRRDSAWEVRSAPLPGYGSRAHSAEPPEQQRIDLPAPEPAAAAEAEVPVKYDFRYVGEVLSTYLIAERGDSIFLIDKHAAHERILFDRLKASKREAAPQILLTPIICDVGGDTAETLLDNAELLGELGFEIDSFGGGSVALRQAPLDVDLSEPEAFLEEIAGKLRAGGRRDIEEMRDGVLHTVACKAAIKAGRRSEPAEVQELIARVLSGEIRYCPHGRPVCLELTKSELDRSFKRI